MRLMLFFFVIFFTACQDNIEIVDKVYKVYDDSPKWVKKIKNSEQIKDGDRCYQISVVAFNEQDGRKKVINNIYSQISNEILSVVNSDYSTFKQVRQNNATNVTTLKTNLKSFADISGIHIKHYYFKNNKAYGYVCISDEKFNSLKKENDKKRKEYIEDIKKLRQAINNDDIEKANNIILEMKSKFNMLDKRVEFNNLLKKLNNVVKIDIDIKQKFRVYDNLTATVFSNKDVYLYVILQHKDKNILLYPKNGENGIIVANKLHRIMLVNKIKPSLKGYNKITFLITKTPIEINKYSDNRGELYDDWKLKIASFKNNYYLKEITKGIKVLDSTKNLKICLKRELDKKDKWAKMVYRKFKKLLKKKVQLVPCQKDTNNDLDDYYELLLKYSSEFQDDNEKVVDINLKLSKDNETIDEIDYSDNFYTNQKSAVNDIIIPQIYNNYKKLMDNLE